jgi:Tol biopolymer transport system component
VVPVSPFGSRVLIAIGTIACLGVTASAAGAQGQDRPPGRIAYSTGEIWLVNADGSGKRKRLTTTSDNYAPVVWSASGQWLAFERHYDGPQRDCCVEVRMMRVDGRRKVKLTPHGAEDAGPAWSPTAPRIAFSRRYGYGPTGIYVAKPTEAVREGSYTTPIVRRGRPTDARSRTRAASVEASM